MNKKIISLFSGAGGLDKGFEEAGFSIVWANEFDKSIHETYQKNYPSTFLDKRSIRDVPLSDIPNDIIGIIGGPPCQSWSLAGAMRGIDDERGQLFYEYLRILKDKQPLFFLVENVAGILSSAHIGAFERILEMFSDCGYNISYKLLNANDYGVPQDRLRVFLVGYRKDLNIFFDFEKLQQISPKPKLSDCIKDLQSAKPFDKKNPDIVFNNEYMEGSFSRIFMSRNRKRNWDQPSFTIQAGARHAPLHPDSCEMKKINPDEWIFTNNDYRRLSVREIARIQTFPDSFVFCYKNISDGYKMIGNAVPVRLAKKIAKLIFISLFKPE